MTKTYLSETMIVTAQNIIDRTGKTLSGVSGSPCGCAKASLKAYSGLVPMSPNTTPSAPSISARRGWA